jgi:hypothetical protein
VAAGHVVAVDLGEQLEQPLEGLGLRDGRPVSLEPLGARFREGGDEQIVQALEVVEDQPRPEAAVFVLTPFCLGLFSSLAFGLRQRRRADECALVGAVAVTVVSVALMGFALEGVICIVMALPLTLALGIGGALVGHAIQARGLRRWNAHAMSIAVLVLPPLMGAEAIAPDHPPLREVTTSIVIDAPPSVVWRQVIAVEPLPEPTELVFRVGIAYPTRATLDGTGVGAIRRCTFTTGDFVEPITVWEPGRRLEFDVRSQPAPMRELSPYGGVHPPHLDGFLRSDRGRFVLVRLPDGRTLLQGTTWYRNRMWPQAYWGLWSDALIRKIHGRVLRHIGRVAEAHAGGSGA